MTVSSASSLFGRPVTHLHCVGVGGMGMAPLAIYLAQSGYYVSGEDDALGDELKVPLARAGVVLSGLRETCELVVLSSAISAAHPTARLAMERGIRMVKRGELLAEVMRDRRLVAVCGSHGKTIATAMLITILQQSGFEAGYILGGLFADAKIPPASVGRNDWVVAEVDESDGTIASFSPEITLAVNLDWDHVDHYRQASEIITTFADLFARTKGNVLLNDSCTVSAGLTEGKSTTGSAKRFTFGTAGDFSSVNLTDEQDDMTLQLGGCFASAQINVKSRGAFNAMNATGALAAAQLMGVNFSQHALAEFPGVRRRQSVLEQTNDLLVLEDYAHHPTEISALLTSFSARKPKRGRLLVVFQPHRFSRTAGFVKEFAAALSLADRVYLLDVYGAGEAEIEGGTSEILYQECLKLPPALGVEYIREDTLLYRMLNRELKAGDWLAFVGAGSIDQKAREWLAVRKMTNWAKFSESMAGKLSPATKFTREESLADKTTMQVGGSARLYAEPADIKDLQLLVRTARAEGVKIHPLGRGSNLIVTDEGVDGLVLSLAHRNWAEFEVRAGGHIWVGAGLRLKNLCGLAAKAGLVGFEFLEGIPGNVGGALRMNAGAMGGWMFDIVEEVQLMKPGGETLMLKKSDMQVEYRRCSDLDDAIALGALLRPAASADFVTVKRQIDVYRNKRKESQPREPSAGCIFKNPPGESAGKLIEETGLKGVRVGGAEVSAIHANFIINRDHASGADVLGLIRQVREKVRRSKGVVLEPEAQLFGRNWEDVL